MSERKERTAKFQRQRIINATRTMFPERCYEAISVAQIAEATGISVGAVYLYFESKAEIFRAMYEQDLGSCFEDTDRIATLRSYLPWGAQ